MDDLVIPQATDSLETWLSYLEKRHFKPIDMGLDRIRAVAERLDLLKPAPYVITVAGTNGKGSTCKLLETALRKSGLKVGVYSSPHLFHYNERVRIQGQSVSDADLVQVFDNIERNRTQSLTYFEMGTLAAFALFKQANLDVAILEVGLGGRLDATNIVDADFAVITSIDIDHVEFLGDNREAIGYEKAGIFREGIPVQIGDPDCPQSIITYAKALNCRLYRRNVDWHYRVESDRLQWQSTQKQLNLPLPKIPIPNCATAVAVLTSLPFAIRDQAIIDAVSETQMVGRFQQLTKTQLQKKVPNEPLADVIVDVGHNPHAARYLADQLQAIRSTKNKIYAIFSVLADKDLTGIVSPLAEVIDEWYCAGLNVFRGQSGESVCEKLQSAIPQATAWAFVDIAQASQAVFEKATEQDLVIVFGSFHTVAAFMQDVE